MIRRRLQGELIVAGLDADIAAFDRMRGELETRWPRAWVLFCDGRFIDAFADFEAAATVAVERYDRGPYLIRQVGVEAVQLSGGMVFRPKHVLDTGGL